MTNNIIQFQAHTDNTHFLKGGNKKEIYLYVDLKAATAPTTEERIPLNIALVIDRSGSMSGDKLKYVKKATDFVIDNLNASDSLAIVQYDNRVSVVSETGKVTNKKRLHDLVAQIRTGGSTNLSGGMLEGYNQVDASKGDNYVNRVLLLSDGLANAGITDPQKLQTIAQNKFRNLGIGLSTFGVGADFNEHLMTNLAEYGGANYYFIDQPDRIPEIFAKELEGLLSVVAQNAKLAIHFPSELITCSKVYGYPAVIGNGKVAIDFNDVFSEEQKAILIKFELEDTLQTDLQFDLDFSYDDAVDTLEKVRIMEQRVIRLTTNTTTIQDNVHPVAAQNIALFEANDLYEQAIKLMDSYKYDAAKVLITKAVTILETTLKLFPDATELQRQLEQIKAYESQMKEMKDYSRGEMLIAQKTSRMSNYAMRKKRK